MGRTTLATVLGVLLLLPAAASAATVRLDAFSYGGSSRYESGGLHSYVEYKAGPAETSSLRVDLRGHRFVLADSSAHVRALDGCRRVDGHTAVCDEPADTTDHGLEITLGGGPNEFAIGAVDAEIPFDAVIRAGPAADDIDVRQGGGRTWIYAGRGNDTIVGGRGDDRIFPGDGADAVDGNAGVDAVDFTASRGRVLASLPDGSADVDGDTDTLQRLENLTGSRYDDRLEGNAGPNWLIGGEGDDRLLGLSGRDELHGAGLTGTRHPRPPEHNLLFGGPGNDELEPDRCGADDVLPGQGANIVITDAFSGECADPGPGSRRGLTRIFCSSANDVFDYPGPSTMLVGCRRFRTPGFVDLETSFPPPARLSPGWSAAVRVPCPYYVRPCVERLRLIALRTGVLLGSNSLRRPRGGTRTLRTGLSARGRAYLRGHPHALVKVVLNGRQWDEPLGTEYVVALYPPARPDPTE